MAAQLSEIKHNNDILTYEMAVIEFSYAYAEYKPQLYVTVLSSGLKLEAFGTFTAVLKGMV